MAELYENHVFHLKAYRAVDEPELCAEYITGHKKVLTDYGIINVTSYNNSWIDNPNMYCVIAVSAKTGEMLGGIRIQVADGVFPLPVEDAIGKLDPKIHDKVRFFAMNGGVSELCGLWVSNKLKGIGMSYYLVRAAIASANQLLFQTLIGICAKYSLQMFNDVGFIIDYSMGSSGDFPYPNDSYIAHVVGILNAVTLESANEHDKGIMQILRSSPVQERIETHKEVQSKIFYNLRFDKLSPHKYHLK